MTGRALRILALALATAGATDARAEITCARAGEYWGYDPAEARAFGKHVQTILRENDTEAFLDILHGELGRGPGRAEIRQRELKGAFTTEWLKQVLADQPPCKPVGWRGFMLARGKLWYRKIGDAWRVFAVNGWPSGKSPHGGASGPGAPDAPDACPPTGGARGGQ